TRFSRDWSSDVCSSDLPFDRVMDAQIADWSAWHRSCDECCARPAGVPAHLQDQFVTSVTVLRTHLDKTYPGAMVASLSVPWGDKIGRASGREGEEVAGG